MSDKKGLETLKVWRKSMDFVKHVYENALPLLPKEEKWGIADQLRRASVSIPVNIAEGYGRYYYQEGVRFCLIARGSLEESLTLLTLASELSFLPQQELDELRAEAVELRKMISGYIAYLKRVKRGENAPGAPHTIKEESVDYLADDDWPLITEQLITD